MSDVQFWRFDKLTAVLHVQPDHVYTSMTGRTKRYVRMMLRAELRGSGIVFGVVCSRVTYITDGPVGGKCRRGVLLRGPLPHS